jgi:hypothetical protein
MTQIKVYPAPWMRWFVLALLVPVWIFITYSTFILTGEDRVPVYVWVFVTVIFAFVGTMLFLGGARRMPTHVLEVDDEDIKRLLGKGK